MASSGDITDEVSPRSLPSVRREYNKRTDKQFDINQSRLSVAHHPDLQESMLAYSKHMRKISEGRKKISLEVRAHHVPKHSIGLIPRPRPKIVALNELLIKKKKPFHERKKSPKSAKSLPNLSIRQLSQQQLKISFVSASDLHDIMDYKVKPDKRWESSQFTLWPGEEYVSSSSQDSDNIYSRSDPGVISELKPLQEISKNHRHVRKPKQSSDSHKGAGKAQQCKTDVPGEHPSVSVKDNKRERVTSHHDKLDVQRDRFMYDSVDTKAFVEPPTLKYSSSLSHKSGHRSNQLSVDVLPSSYKQELDYRTMHRPAGPTPIDTHPVGDIPKGYIVPPLQLPKSPARTHGITAKYLVKMGSLRQRPRRAKRMKLHRPELGVIPEGEGGGVENNSDVGEPLWPPGGRIVFYPTKSSYDAIKQFRDNPNGNTELLSLLNSDVKASTAPVQPGLKEPSKSKHSRDNENRILKEVQFSEEREPMPSDVYEELPEEEEEEDVGDASPSSGASSDRSTKLRAQKKLTKLVFLRDVPERHYHKP